MCALSLLFSDDHCGLSLWLLSLKYVRAHSVFWHVKVNQLVSGPLKTDLQTPPVGTQCGTEWDVWGAGVNGREWGLKAGQRGQNA